MIPTEKTKDCKMNFWDKMGVLTSAVCIVHCIALPMILVFLPTLVLTSGHGNHTIWEEIFHFLILFAIIFFAAIAFYRGYKRHNDIRPIRYLVAGLSLVIFVITIGHEIENLYLRYGLNILGSLLLIRAHILNHICRKCDHSHSHQ